MMIRLEIYNHPSPHLSLQVNRFLGHAPEVKQRLIRARWEVELGAIGRRNMGGHGLIVLPAPCVERRDGRGDDDDRQSEVRNPSHDHAVRQIVSWVKEREWHRYEDIVEVGVSARQSEASRFDITTS
jgi:hypothetical protein